MSHLLRIAAVVLPAALAVAAAADTDPERRNREVVQRLFDEGFSGGRLEVIDALVSPDFEFFDPNLPPGRDGLKAIVRKNNESFEDWHFTLHDVIAEGAKVVVRWTGEGRHTGSFMGETPTGETVRLDGISIYELDDGVIVRDWVVPDNFRFLQQLGLLPAQQLVE